MVENMGTGTKDNYKLIIFGNGIYQEVVLADKFENGVVIGTTGDSRVRFDREDFFCDFEISINNSNGWNVSCNHDIYIDSDRIIKVYSRKLESRDEIVFRYASSDAEFLRISFLPDFDSATSDYSGRVALGEVSNFCIGGPDFCRIQLKGERVGDDYLTLTRSTDSFTVNINKTTYGVFLNGMEVRDELFTLNNFDFLVFDGYKFYFKDMVLYMDSADPTIVSRLTKRVEADSETALRYPKFVKNVRLRNRIDDTPIKVLPPEAKKDAGKENLFLTLIPSIFMLALIIVLRSQMGSNAMMAIYMGAMMGMGILTSVITHFAQKKKLKKDEQERVENYTAYIKNKEKEIQAARDKELADRKNIYVAPRQELEEVRKFDFRLFEKGMGDSDFLELRVGTGSVKAARTLNIPEAECIKSDDPLEDYPRKLQDAYCMIEDAPVTLDLKKNGVVGIVGQKAAEFDMLKVLTLELAARHFFKDVKLFYIFREEEQAQFSSLRWLQNIYLDEQSSIRNLIYDKEGKKGFLEILFKELSERESYSDAAIYEKPYIVVFVYDSEGFMNHPVSNFLAKAEVLRAAFLFFSEDRELIPAETKKLMILERESDGRPEEPQQGRGAMIDAKDLNNRLEFSYESVTDSALEAVSRRLGCVYIDSVNLEGTLTRNISLYRLLDIISVRDLNLAERWKASEVYRSMAAPIGVRTEDRIVSLDLHERAHGPHGLVAGTTGSGKSELLQTYILSMATLFSPEDVSFVIIDFKGGGMANQFRELPHLIGTITNIDGDAIDRSLASIHAELRKRQDYFKEYNVNHIDAYIKLYKQKKAKKPLPHLILIVDEFAELRNDQPEFMQELISAARIGRSLGVHLILATQKPAGVVNDQIWSNSRFKLCLKVQDKSDSNEVLHSPLAAEIREAGRAYLQVGNNEIFELFQSAYSGADVDSEKSGIASEYSVSELDLMGRGKVIFEQKAEKKKDGENTTQLEAIVAYIRDYCAAAGIPKVSDICLPELPVRVTAEEAESEASLSMAPSESTGDVEVTLGIYDDPDHQEQNSYRLNLSKGHTVIIGSPQFGKTNVIQQILRQLMKNYTPVQVNAYILDYASMTLRAFQDSDMVGGVVTASEDDKMNHFIRLMQDEFARRRELLAAAELSSYEAYREAGHRDLPQIVVFVDNFTGLKEMYLQREDFLLPMLREGVTLGITFVVTDIQTSGMGFRYQSLLSNRIALFCNDANEYTGLFGYCKKKMKNLPGRSIIEIDKKTYYCQTFLAFSGEREMDRVEDMKRFIEKENLRYGGVMARRIPEVPERFTTELLARYEGAGLERMEYRPYFGVGYSSAVPEALAMSGGGTMAVLGGEDELRTRWISNLLWQLLRDTSHRVELTIVDDYRKLFGTLEDYVHENGLDPYHSVHYTADAESIKEVFGELTAYAQEMQEKLKTEPGLKGQLPLKLVLLQNREVYDIINKDRGLLEQYKNLIGKYRGFRILLFFTDLENVKLPYTGVDVQKSIQENKNLFILESISKLKLFDVSPNVARQFAKPLSKTEGIFVSEDGFERYRLLV